ncbi:hypothetical protein [uncultured Paracoccus sp.]|uniref:hypothetical protein n=1 Tax=uncultured Paracoccus sp. TaxID=189685 RepID=UPI0025F737A3|nr:hypothetical protein [uncultured Paracoccus sp.]
MDMRRAIVTPLRAAIAIADSGDGEVDQAAAMAELAGATTNGLVGAAEAVFAGRARKQGDRSGGPRDFRVVFVEFIRSESDAAVSRVKVDDPAMQEAVRCEGAARALLSAAEVPGAGKLAGSVGIDRAWELAGLMSGAREAFELEQGVSAWSGKRLPKTELDRRRVELDPLHMLVARKIVADPVGNACSAAARGWMIRRPQLCGGQGGVEWSGD